MTLPNKLWTIVAGAVVLVASSASGMPVEIDDIDPFIVDSDNGDGFNLNTDFTGDPSSDTDDASDAFNGSGAQRVARVAETAGTGAISFSNTEDGTVAGGSNKSDTSGTQELEYTDFAGGSFDLTANGASTFLVDFETGTQSVGGSTLDIFASDTNDSADSNSVTGLEIPDDGGFVNVRFSSFGNGFDPSALDQLRYQINLAGNDDVEFSTLTTSVPSPAAFPVALAFLMAVAATFRPRRRKTTPRATSA